MRNGRVVGGHGLTEPIARKNENVAALLSMYCESVARAPLGPAPPLLMDSPVQSDVCDWGRVSPEDSVRTKNEANGETDTSTHEGTHSDGHA